MKDKKLIETERKCEDYQKKCVHLDKKLIETERKCEDYQKTCAHLDKKVNDLQRLMNELKLKESQTVVDNNKENETMRLSCLETLNDLLAENLKYKSNLFFLYYYLLSKYIYSLGLYLII